MKKKLTKSQLEILLKCWKDGENTKEWLELIEKNLPGVSPLAALSIMRNLIKTNEEWQKVSARRKNKKKKEKKEKILKREQRKEELQRKKAEREKQKAEKDKVREHKEKIVHIKRNLCSEDFSTILEKILSEYFFCSDVDQYVNNISCIFKIFSDEYKSICDSKCDKCNKMNKHISILEDIINAKSKKTRRHSATKDGSKAKKETAPTKE